MTSQSKSRLGRKWYFEKLDLRAVRCNLSLIPRPGFHEVDVGSNSNRYRLATALGIHFINITDVPLRLSALQLKNAFVSPQSLLAQLLRHLVYQVSPRTDSQTARESCCVSFEPSCIIRVVPS